MKLITQSFFVLFIVIALEGSVCAQGSEESNVVPKNIRLASWSGPTFPSTIAEIPLPDGFERIATHQGSYEAFLQHLCLKTDTTIYLYNGEKKPDQTFGFLVVDLDVGEKNLQQCADAVIRLRSEYLFANHKFDDIHFNFTSGHTAYYSEWRKGYRAKVSRNQVMWKKEAEYDDSYPGFRNYLNLVFNYAGSWSLEKELKTIRDIKNIQIGDMLIRGAFPGHVMLVVDMARHRQSGEVLFLLAQSARPAQDFHIVKNRSDSFLSPWYSLDALNTQLEIEEWTFYKDSLKRF